jgi:ubiquinone/menaquinone biosynthesis C-methylase UbiE
MKDIVENRSHISLSTKFRLAALALRENGSIWTMQMGIYYLASGLAGAAYSAAASRRIAKNLPGVNSARMNKIIWNNWDWKAKGEEWSISPAWKASVIGHLLRPNIRERADVVEIGPGGGRWTEELIARCNTVKAVDISEACVKECQLRFKDAGNAEFIVGSGSDLKAIRNASVDAIWSFDVFVHVNKPEFRNYASEFARVLRPGGRGVIQHGAVGGRNGGWRSDARTEDVARFLQDAGLTVEQQILEWQDNEAKFAAGLYGDVVTIFSKPV